MEENVWDPIEKRFGDGTRHLLLLHSACTVLFF